MSRICLDTSAYSRMRLGHEEALRLIRRAAEVAIPVVAIGELRAGFRSGDREAENEESLRQFLVDRFVRVLDVDEEAAAHYADVYADLRRAGTPVPTNDIWIAAVALREGMTLLTFDDHFSRIRRVGVHLLKP